MLPSRRFITSTNNIYAALAENDNNDNDNDNANVHASVLVLKHEVDDNSFDNYIALKVGADNSDVLAKEVNNVNTGIVNDNNDNNSISTINCSKEGVRTICIIDTPGTGNSNSDNTIEPSNVGVGKKESNTVIVHNKEHINSITSHNNDNYNMVTTTNKKEIDRHYDNDTSVSTNDYNLIHNTNLDLDKGSPPRQKISQSMTTINDFIPLSIIPYFTCIIMVTRFLHVQRVYLAVLLMILIISIIKILDLEQRLKLILRKMNQVL